MFKILKRKEESKVKTDDAKKEGVFGRLKMGLRRTRQNITEGVANTLLGKKVVDDELIEDIETQLLTADLGIETTQLLISDLTKRLARKQLNDAEAVFSFGYERQRIRNSLVEKTGSLASSEDQQSEFVVSFLGEDGEKFFSRRIADEYPFSPEMGKRALEGDQGFFDPREQHSIGEPGVEVLFRDQRRNPEPRCQEDYRA